MVRFCFLLFVFCFSFNLFSVFFNSFLLACMCFPTIHMHVFSHCAHPSSFAFCFVGWMIISIVFLLISSFGAFMNLDILHI